MATKTAEDWCSELIPSTIRRPWMVFEEDVADKLEEANEEGVDLQSVREQLSAVQGRGAKAAFLELPEDEQAGYAEVSLQELSAFASWRSGRLAALGLSPIDELPQQEEAAWDLLDCDTKAEWIPQDDAREVLSQDGSKRWDPLLKLFSHVETSTDDCPAAPAGGANSGEAQDDAAAKTQQAQESEAPAAKVLKDASSSAVAVESSALKPVTGAEEGADKAEGQPEPPATTKSSDAEPQEGESGKEEERTKHNSTAEGDAEVRAVEQPAKETATVEQKREATAPEKERKAEAKREHEQTDPETTAAKKVRRSNEGRSSAQAADAEDDRSGDAATTPQPKAKESKKAQQVEDEPKTEAARRKRQRVQAAEGEPKESEKAGRSIRAEAVTSRLAKQRKAMAAASGPPTAAPAGGPTCPIVTSALAPADLCPEALSAVCCVCGDGEATPDNDIAICDGCDKAYHQKCHIPVVRHFGRADEQWFCGCCAAEIATERDLSLKAGDYAWVRWGNRKLSPAKIIKIDFTSKEDSKPYWAHFFEKPTEGAWVGEADVTAWLQGPSFASLRDNARRQAVLQAESDGAPKISTGELQTAAPRQSISGPRGNEGDRSNVSRPKQRSSKRADGIDAVDAQLQQQVKDMRELIAAARTRTEKLREELAARSKEVSAVDSAEG